MTAVVPHLVRVLSLKPMPMRGEDVEAVRRGAIRYLGDDLSWKRYKSMPTVSARTFGPGMRSLVRRVQRHAGLVVDGKAGAAVDRVLRKYGGYDAECDRLLSIYQVKAKASELPPCCYPHRLGSDTSHICQDLHPTAGLGPPTNWAIDFCATPGTIVVAVMPSEVVKISGHPPSYVVDPSVGIFGWNLYYTTPSGYRYFSTHYGELLVRVGQRLKVGQAVGRVGRWPGDVGRSHTHLGVTSPKGDTDSKITIERVAHAPRLAA